MAARKHQPGGVHPALLPAAIALAVLALAAHAPGATPFTVVALPDTQHYSESHPEIFTSQTQWIVDNAAGRNIVFVTQEGDLTNNATSGEFSNAAGAMYLLDGQVPWATAPGNHDVGEPAYQEYLANFGPDHFAGASWYGGSYGASSCQYFSGGGRTFLHLAIQVDAPGDVLAWAQGVLDLDANVPALVTTHDYMTDGGRTGYGEALWSTLISPNPQVFMVLCGHMHYEWNQTSNNGAEKPVLELLADYQDWSNGGDGYLRLMEFDEDANVIHVRTYSPYLDSYETGPSSQFDLAMDFAERLGPVPEPASLWTLILGGLAVLRRRRVPPGHEAPAHGPAGGRLDNGLAPDEG